MLISSAFILSAGIIILVPLQTRERQLQNEVEQLRSQGRESLATAKQQYDLNNAWFKVRNNPLNVGALFAEIQSLLPSGVELTNLEYKEGGLSLQGTTENAEHIESLLVALKSAKLTHPLLTTYQQTEQASITFVIKTGYKSK